MTHPLRVAANCTTHPLHKAQNLMTHPLSAPAHPRLYFLTSPLTDFYPKKVTLSGAIFLTEMFEKVSLNPYNFRITRLSARKSEQMKIFRG